MSKQYLDTDGLNYYHQNTKTNLKAADNTETSVVQIMQPLTDEQLAEGLHENIVYSENSAAFGANNIAGSKGYHIISYNIDYKYYLVEGNTFDSTLSEANDSGEKAKYTIYFGSNWDDWGTVDKYSIDGDNTKVYLDPFVYPVDSSNNPTISADTDLSDQGYYIKFSSFPDIGNYTIGSSAFAEGYYNKAIAFGAHSEGYANISNGKYAHTEGKETYANFACHAEGEETKALVWGAHAEGTFTTANGRAAHAEGNYTQALADRAHAEGGFTEAHATDAHSEGFKTKALSSRSHAEGQESITKGTAAHAEGSNTVAAGIASHAEGSNTMAGYGRFTLTNFYQYSDAYRFIANTYKGDDASKLREVFSSATHCLITTSTGAELYEINYEGSNSGIFKYSGDNNANWFRVKVNNDYAQNITFDQSTSFITFININDIKSLAYAEYDMYTSGGHAQGKDSVAIAAYSCVEGDSTVSIRNSQTVVGSYNSLDADAMFIVGNGTSDTSRSNAFTVSTNGDAYANGKKLATQEYVDENSGGNSGVDSSYVDSAISDALGGYTIQVVDTAEKIPENAGNVIYFVKNNS